VPYSKLLVATDGSDHSLKAAAHAAELAKVCRLVEVEVFSVAVEYSPLKGRNPFMQAMQDEAQRAVEATMQVFADAGVLATSVVKLATGNAGREICAEADAIGADMIIMGSRGLGAAATALAGSTSNYVVHCAGKPVLVVH
jgi:nucleotide-binding universal stress UspA family protein